LRTPGHGVCHIAGQPQPAPAGYCRWIDHSLDTIFRTAVRVVANGPDREGSGLLPDDGGAFARGARAVRRAVPSRAVVVAFLALTLVPPVVPFTAADGQLPAEIEYQIKASFVYTVAKFVDWPQGSFPSAEAPLTLGVIADDDAVSDAIAAALKGKRVHDRALVVLHVPDARRARECQILYVGGGRAATDPGVLGLVAAPGVLTVGEGRTFAREGGILGLTLQESMVQFEVNIEAAQKAGLVISSKILRLGRVVGGVRPAAAEGRR